MYTQELTQSPQLQNGAKMMNSFFREVKHEGLSRRARLMFASGFLLTSRYK